MAQTSRRRRRKHRGTQSGSIDRRGRASRPRSRQEAVARARSRQRTSRRADSPPTWSGAMGMAGLGAAIFFVALLVFGQPPGGAAGIAALMFLLYIPMGYYTQLFFWRRRQAKQARARAERER